MGGGGRNAGDGGRGLLIQHVCMTMVEETGTQVYHGRNTAII